MHWLLLRMKWVLSTGSVIDESSYDYPDPSVLPSSPYLRSQSKLLAGFLMSSRRVVSACIRKEVVPLKGTSAIQKNKKVLCNVVTWAELCNILRKEFICFSNVY